MKTFLRFLRRLHLIIYNVISVIFAFGTDGNLKNIAIKEIVGDIYVIFRKM